MARSRRRDHSRFRRDRRPVDDSLMSDAEWRRQENHEEDRAMHESDVEADRG